MLATAMVAMVTVTPVQAKEPMLIGVLTVTWGSTPTTEAVRAGLIALGHKDFQDFVMGVRFTQGDSASMEQAARGLVRSGAQIIVVQGAVGALAAQRATSTIPIVFVHVDDPVELGLVNSYAKPGGNITGVSSDDHLLSRKRLEFLKRMVPSIKKVLFPYDAADQGALSQLPYYRDAATRLGLTLVERPLENQDQASAFLGALRKGDVDGIASPVSANSNIPGYIIEASVREGIPTIFANSFWLEFGALASYSPSFESTGKQAARLVDKIMKGDKPSDIPVEVNSTILFSINLKVAKALNLAIPVEVLYRADRIVR